MRSHFDGQINRLVMKEFHSDGGVEPAGGDVVTFIGELYEVLPQATAPYFLPVFLSEVEVQEKAEASESSTEDSGSEGAEM